LLRISAAHFSDSFQLRHLAVSDPLSSLAWRQSFNATSDIYYADNHLGLFYQDTQAHAMGLLFGVHIWHLYIKLK